MIKLLKFSFLFIIFIVSCNKDDFAWDLPKTNPYEGIDTTGVQIPNPESPVVITTGHLNITTTSFDATGNINSIGSSEITHYGHCWATSPMPDTNDAKSDFGSINSTTSFTSSITNLLPSTQYYVRTYAVNSYGLSYGNQIIVQTNSLYAPTVSTGYLTNLTQNSANMVGNLSSEGSGPISSYGHCWVSNGGIPTINDSKTDLGNAISLGNFISSLSNLNPSQNYKVRAYATNNIGTSYGEIISFTTSEYICDSTACNSLVGIINVRYEANLNSIDNGWIISNNNSIFGSSFLASGCHGGYIQFTKQVNSDFKIRFWIQSYDQGSWANIIPFLYIDNQVQNCSIISGNNSGDWIQLESNALINGGNRTIKIEFPYNGNSIRNYYVDQIEFSCF
jgi:hypothetical protein